MMYLPYKQDQEAEARQLMVDMFELVLPVKVADAMVQKDVKLTYDPSNNELVQVIMPFMTASEVTTLKLRSRGSDAGTANEVHAQSLPAVVGGAVRDRGVVQVNARFRFVLPLPTFVLRPFPGSGHRRRARLPCRWASFTADRRRSGVDAHLEGIRRAGRGVRVHRARIAQARSTQRSAPWRRRTKQKHNSSAELTLLAVVAGSQWVRADGQKESLMRSKIPSPLESQTGSRRPTIASLLNSVGFKGVGREAGNLI
jgi:hypothetical protein